MGEKIQISLRAARVNAGMTQEDVAKIMQVSRQTIANWEKGKISPKISEIMMLSKVYNTPSDYIFLPYESTKSRQSNKE